MKHAVSQDLHAYWNALRGARSAPERGEIDPAAIRHILAYTFILEVTGPPPVGARDLRFRLSGTRVSALFGDQRGRSFDRIWASDQRDRVDMLLDGVLDDRAAVVASTRAGPGGHRPVDLELLLLPLRHHGRTHARILGSLAGAEIPAWMGLLPATGLEITGFRSLPTGQEERARFVGAAPAAVTAPAARGRFRVYDGGRQQAARHVPGS